MEEKGIVAVLRTNSTSTTILVVGVNSAMVEKESGERNFDSLKSRLNVDMEVKGNGALNKW